MSAHHLSGSGRFRAGSCLAAAGVVLTLIAFQPPAQARSENAGTPPTFPAAQPTPGLPGNGWPWPSRYAVIPFDKIPYTFGGGPQNIYIGRTSGIVADPNDGFEYNLNTGKLDTYKPLSPNLGGQLAPNAMSNDGHVVGHVYPWPVTDGHSSLGVIWYKGKLTDVPPQGFTINTPNGDTEPVTEPQTLSFTYINDKDEIVGTEGGACTYGGYLTPCGFTVSYSGGSLSTSGSIPSSAYSQPNNCDTPNSYPDSASAIDDSGTIYGSSCYFAPLVRWTGSSDVSPINLPRCSGNIMFDDCFGTVMDNGYTTNNGGLFYGPGFRPVTAPGTVAATNAHGWTITNSHAGPILWSPAYGGAWLNNLFCGSYRAELAYGIDEQGDIVGEGVDANRQTSNFVAVPADSAAARFAKNDCTSVVQLGDSITSGEGTLYGWKYDSTNKTWSGPANANPAWEQPYPNCHDSLDAYGNIVAADLGASFLQLGCTGASWVNGITDSNHDPDNGSFRGPSEFGDWFAKRNLNPHYDAARPDLVLVTMGADDIKFADIIVDCITSHWLDAKITCTSANPGPAVVKDFEPQIKLLPRHLKELVAAIEDRGKNAKPAKVPKMLFTDYYVPFPPGDKPCADTWNLTHEQLQYLDNINRTMDALIRNTLKPLESKNLKFVDLQNAFAGHGWCSTDPWVYGLSIAQQTKLDPNPAPFHPTPFGQRVISGYVEPAAATLLKK